jgi:hypothetical protein
MQLDSKFGSGLGKLMAACGLIALAGLLSSFLLLRPDSARANSEQYCVYSGYLTQGLTGEPHSLGRVTGAVVIEAGTISAKPSFSMFEELRFVNRHSPFPSLAPLVDLLVENVSRHRLERFFVLPAKYDLTTEAEAGLYPTAEFQKRFPGNYGYHKFTRVGFNRSLTEAVFYTEHICGMCGEGKYVFMRKQQGKWTILGEVSRWVS